MIDAGRQVAMLLSLSACGLAACAQAPPRPAPLAAGRAMRTSEQLAQRGAPGASDDASVYSLSTSEKLGELATRHEPWQTLVSPSFVIFHFNPQLAQQIVRAAERQRLELLQRWGVSAGQQQVAWRPRCQIAVYRTSHDLAQMTGGDAKAGSAAARAARLSPGQTLSRRIALTAQDRALLTATLPHEIMHIVVSDALGGRVPLWANEGMATLAEGGRRQRSYARTVAHAASAGRLIPLGRLVAMTEYPAGSYELHLFYAQSTSVTGYLVSLRDPPAFLSFLRRERQQRFEAALRAEYSIASLAELETRWAAALSTLP